MPTKEVKIIFLGFGVLLLLAAFMAYFYEMPQVGWYGFGSHPYFREYVLPIGIVARALRTLHVPVVEEPP